VHTSELVHGVIQYVSEHVTTHPPTRQTKAILNFLDCADEVLECLPPTVYHVHYVLDNNHNCCSSYMYRPGCTI